MDLIRLPKKQKLYDVEKELGRDSRSVFPSGAAAQDAVTPADAAKSLSAQRFVSETELAELRQQQGQTGDEGPQEPLKPLTQVLAENKEAHEAKFQAVWKSMKTGKNRPLDEDDLAFIHERLDRERDKEATVAADEREQLAAFKQAMQAARDQKAPPGRQKPAVPIGPELPPLQAQRKPVQPKSAQPRPVLRAVARPRQGRLPANAQPSVAARQPCEAVQPAAAVLPQKQSSPEQRQVQDGEGQVMSLLGDYASSSDQD